MRQLLFLFMIPVLAKTFVVPVTVTVGDVKLGGSVPYVLQSIQVSGGESGSCTYGWWKGLLKANYAQEKGYYGQGVKVLIIDTGADAGVLSLLGRKVAWYYNAAYEVHKDECLSFFTYKNITFCVFAKAPYGSYELYYAVPVNDTTDLTGHGTAVAAALLSVAPNVTLYVAKVAAYVFEVGPQGKVIKYYPTVDPAALALALRRATLGPDGVSSSDDPQVVNMSLGSVPPVYALSQDILDESVLNYLYVAPISQFSSRELFVAAAGNEAQNLADVPALLKDVIGVSALVYVNGTLAPAPFTNGGPGVDFSSLGMGLHLPVPAYSYIASVIDDQCAKRVGDAVFLRLDGTSFASPLVAGVAAIWIERTGAQGTGAVLDVMKQHVIKLSNGWSPKYGWGMPVADDGETNVPSPALLVLLLLPFLKRRKKFLALLFATFPAFALSQKALGASTALGLLGSWFVLSLFGGSTINDVLLTALVNTAFSMVLLLISWFVALKLLRAMRGQ